MYELHVYENLNNRHEIYSRGERSIGKPDILQSFSPCYFRIADKTNEICMEVTVATQLLWKRLMIQCLRFKQVCADSA